MNLTTCTHGAHKIHSGKIAKDLYLTTCTHGAHKIHSCKNKGVHTAKPFRVYRQGPWPCTDEAPDRMYRRGRYPCDPGQNHPRVLATLAQNHPRVLATPESACTADPLTFGKDNDVTNQQHLRELHTSHRFPTRCGYYSIPSLLTKKYPIQHLPSLNKKYLLTSPNP